VNVSGRQFRQHDFANTVATILAETRMPAAALELELTETVFMQETGLTVATFAELRRMGANCYRRFRHRLFEPGYFKRFGVDRLKIDQSFIRDISTNRNDSAIVTAIMAMARSLQIEVTAEGVETHQQLQYLREQGCLEAQGYLFSHPPPATEIEQFMQLTWNLSLWRQPSIGVPSCDEKNLARTLRVSKRVPML
jgi:EAL domain-containing protein (putative c-di-GMP-specific phosphodiesterase class I)